MGVSRPATPHRAFPRRHSNDSRGSRTVSMQDDHSPGRARDSEPPSDPPMSPPAASSLRELPPDVVAEALSNLDASDLPSAELSCRAVRGIITQRDAWRVAYTQQCRQSAEEWRAPDDAPKSWKRFYHQSRRERGLQVTTKIPKSSAEVVWRVALPRTPQHARQRSREFAFSADALGQPIRWQIEVELNAALPLPAHAVGTPGAPAHVTLVDEKTGEEGPYRQTGLIRMWTTNQWTADATRHYYGSHCTMSLRDALGVSDCLPETPVDIDNSHAFEFDAACLPRSRELVIRVNLTLALELMAPLNPFYELIAADVESGGDSDAVKIGYCKAIFEIARCKRKYGGTFVRPCDRNVRALVSLAASDDTSEPLRVEVFQALFNLLGPTSVLLEDDVVVELLGACFRCLDAAPAAPSKLGADQQRAAALLAQNALGAVFNLLVHPLSMKVAAGSNLSGVAALLDDQAYQMCHFSVITVLLTVLSWGSLPPAMLESLERATLGFMAANDPLDSDCTGVAWDESDVAAFFMPLLRARHLLCVRFASWCIAKYYFPHQQASQAIIALGTTA